MRVITSDLSPQGIKKMRDALEQSAHVVNVQTELFVKELAELGIPVIDKRIMEATGDFNDSYNTRIELSRHGSVYRADLILEGADVVFIEFGTGVYYNDHLHSSPHPKGEEFGYTIGDYGYGQGANESWLTPEGVVTHGIEASMPIYSAYLHIIDRFIEIARETFI